MPTRHDHPYPTSHPSPGTGWGGHDGAGDTPSTAHAFETADGERYRLNRLLASGGMGTVHLAWDARLRRTVAVKFAAPAPAAEARLAQEAWIAAHLEHPGVLPVYDAGVSRDGRRYLVTRYVRGPTLRALLARGSAPRVDLLPILRKAAAAIAHAHASGIVHRDLTPSNILVGAFDEVQVLDWGLARPIGNEVGDSWAEVVLPGEDAAETRAGIVLGTPGYMSPEQAVGAPIDPRADVWALGAITYELLTGHPPFGELDDQARQRAIAIQGVPDVRSETPDVPAPLATLVADALARKPDDRPADADDFLDRLRRAVPEPKPARASWGWLPPAVMVAALATSSAFLARDAFAPPPAVDARVALRHTWAADAARAGALPEAELRAAVATAEVDQPGTRGWLAHARAGARPVRTSGAPVPLPCEQTHIGPGGTTYLCLRGLEVSSHRLDGTVRWQRALSTPVRDLAAGDRHLALLHADSRAVVLDRDTGEIVGPVLHETHALVSGDGGSEVWLWSSRGLFRAGGATSGDATRFEPPPPDPGHPLPTDLHDGTLVAAGVRTLWWRPPGKAWQQSPPWVSTTPEDGFSLVHGAGDHAIVVARSGNLLRWKPGDDPNLLDPIPVRPGPVALSLSPSGGTAVVTSPDGASTVVDLRAGVALYRLPRHAGALPRLLDDRTVRVAADRVHTWKLPDTTRWPRHIPTRHGGVVALDVQADRLAWAGAGAAEVLDRSGHRLWAMRTPGAVVKAAALSPDGIHVLTVGSLTGKPRLHHLRTGEARALPRVPASGRRAVWLDAEHVATLSYARGGPWVFRVDDLRPLTTWTVPRPVFVDLVAAHEPQLAWGLEENLRLVRLHLPEGRPVLSPPIPLDVTGLVSAPTGPEPWLYTRSRVVRVDPSTGAVVDAIAVSPGVSTAYQIGPDRFATGHLDGHVRIWSREGALLMAARAHEGRVASLALDGDTLFSGAWDGQIRTWDLPTLDAAPEALLRDAQAAWGLPLALADQYPP